MIEALVGFLQQLSSDREIDGGGRCFCSFTTPEHGCRKSPICAISTWNLRANPRVQLHGKGDKWRVCPLWKETVALLKQLEDDQKETISGQNSRTFWCVCLGADSQFFSIRLSDVT